MTDEGHVFKGQREVSLNELTQQFYTFEKNTEDASLKDFDDDVVSIETK